MNRDMLIQAFVLVLIVAVVLYSFSLQINQIAIKPSKILQAGGARFYENFVYNSSKYIPSDCAVFSYDPGLFNINNKTSLQYSYLYVPSFYKAVALNYSCEVIDYGYWCGTPGNICGHAFTEFKTVPIRTATYNLTNFTYGLYMITGINSSSG